MELIKNEKIGTNLVELTASVDAATFGDALTAAFKKQAKNITIPGFRKGRAPRALIEREYGKEVFYNDAIDSLLQGVYEDAVKEAGIEPVDRPEVDIPEVSAEKGFTAVFKVTVKPEVELGEYKGLKVTKTVAAVDESEADKEIDQMRQRNARIITKEGKAENGDITNIDFEGFVDGVAFEGGKGEKFDLTLGSGQFIPGFEDQVVGHEAGEEFDVNVTFPEEYQADLAGKAATFKVKINSVSTRELPEVDDEFAKDVSEFDTLAELKADILKKKQDEADKAADGEVENKLVDMIVDGMKAEIPECMIKNRQEEMVQEFENQLAQSGLQLDMYLKYTNSTREKLAESYKESAEKQVKYRLALEKIAEVENITASDEDYEEELKKLAEQYKMEVEKIRPIIPADMVKKDLALNKAIDFIKANAVVTEEAPKAEEKTAE